MGAKLTQCPNGHYYDAEQYTSCPYCQSVTSNSFNDTDRVTDSFIPAQGSGYGYGGNGNDDRTMPIDHISERQPMRYTSPTATPTAPLNQRTAAQEAYDEGKTVPYFGGFPETDIPAGDNVTTNPSFSGNVRNPKPVVGWLVCVEGTNYGHSFCLYAGKNFVGRASDMDICLKGDDSVSRTKHANITYEPKERQFFAQPGESHELFYVNDNVVLTSAELKDRAEISVGKTKLVFVPFCDSKYGWEK